MDINIRNIQIKTNRLLLRPWMDSDLADFFAYASMPIVGEMAGWKPHETIDEARAFFRGDYFKNECLALYHLADKKAIGAIGLHSSWASDHAKYRHLRCADLGYALHPNYWGNGLVFEASEALIKFAFDHMDIDALTCNHFAENTRSRRVIEKNGFTFDHETEVYAPELDKHFRHMRYILYKNCPAN